MSFFKRNTREAAEAPEPVSPAMVALGDLPCTEHGCSNSTGLECEYVDRRSRRCRTAWCPEHRMVVHDRVYCRRHAGVVRAVPTGVLEASAPLPDLDNRAPSLVNWVSNEVDAEVRRLLLGELGSSGAELIADPVALVFVGIDRGRAWERAWKLAGHTGTIRKVSLMVEEEHDTEVAVKIGPNVVDRIVPPWIGRRAEMNRATPADERRERDQFNEHILDAIDRGLARERELSDVASRDEVLAPKSIYSPPGTQR
ncbi:MAG TPA: hypothetical protein VJU79_00865 [Candidatus Dormibacteraeota bacterium]|nr:hypothetical protein [Candidatus Dormibacteraeota bacterium]